MRQRWQLEATKIVAQDALEKIGRCSTGKSEKRKRFEKEAGRKVASVRKVLFQRVKRKEGTKRTK